MELSYIDKLNEFFYEELNRQSSACLFGSAATGNWSPGRSDLDIILLIPKEKFYILGTKVRQWAQSLTPQFPKLDGYVICRSETGLSVNNIQELERVLYPSNTTVELIDQWMIKYRSKHLFGNDSLSNFFPEISIVELGEWSKKSIKEKLASNPKGIVPRTAINLSDLIWLVSWTARMLMLSRGIICESKREALRWLAVEYTEISFEVSLLLDDYAKINTELSSVNFEQSIALREFCLKLLLKEV